MAQRMFPAGLHMVTNKADMQAARDNKDILIVLDPDCSHCQHLYAAMCTQGVAIPNVSLICGFESDAALEELIEPLPRPVAFPHAVDLATNQPVPLRTLLHKLQITLGA